jgi:hypothetical protein
MFCPKCSQPQPSEDLRFCPRCGFPVGEVKVLFGQEAEREVEERRVRDEGMLPAQKDLATGALLMFAGAVFAVFWGLLWSRGPAEVALPQTFFILGGTLAFILTLCHPLLGALERLLSGGVPANYTQRRRDGINLGALLMFVGELKALVFTSLMPNGPEKGLTTFAIMAGMLLLVLLLRPILRAAHALFFKRERSKDATLTNATVQLDPAQAAALPPAHSIPVNGFAQPRVDTAEMVTPPSITEETTRKLSDL